MFIGKTERKVDDKRRLLLPKGWTCSVLDINNKNHYVVVSKDEAGIFIYPLEYWLNLFKETNNKLEFASNSIHVVVDNRSRLVLPNYLSFKKVILIGMKDYFILKESN